MKKTYRQLSIFALLIGLVVGCAQEVEYVDGMINALCEDADEEMYTLSEMDWESALVSLKDSRQKLDNIRTRIENGDYSGDNYDLDDPTQTLAKVDSTLADVDFKMDSIWDVQIKDSFLLIDVNSAGVSTFGTSAYLVASDDVSSAYAWLKSAYMTDTSALVANDFSLLKVQVRKLSNLNSLESADVEQYIADLEAKFQEMNTQYLALASEVETSPYFTTAQKDLYTKLSTDIDNMQTVLESSVSLETSDVLDLLNRDLVSLVYFTENNYTSPAQAPLVYGEISSITELRWFSEEATAADWSASWTLTADIDASETHRWNQDQDEKGFQQIPDFTANFDGQYHMISGMLMTKFGGPTVNREGMFQNFTGTMKNFALVNLYLQSPIADGGQGGVLIGHLQNGTVQNCFTHGARQLNSQSGGFVGRTLGAVNLIDCFAAVDCDYSGAQGVGATNTSSFLGLPVAGPVTMENCYTLGVSQLRALMGYGAGVNMTAASGLFFDSSVVGITEVGHADAYGETVVRLEDDGVVTDLPTTQWADLANFPTFSADVWEVLTVSEIDANPRPYLKGFNYDILSTFIIPALD